MTDAATLRWSELRMDPVPLQDGFRLELVMADDYRASVEMD